MHPQGCLSNGPECEVRNACDKRCESEDDPYFADIENGLLVDCAQLSGHSTCRTGLSVNVLHETDVVLPESVNIKGITREVINTVQNGIIDAFITNRLTKTVVVCF